LLDDADAQSILTIQVTKSEWCSGVQESDAMTLRVIRSLTLVVDNLKIATVTKQVVQKNKE